MVSPRRTIVRVSCSRSKDLRPCFVSPPAIAQISLSPQSETPSDPSPMVRRKPTTSRPWRSGASTLHRCDQSIHDRSTNNRTFTAARKWVAVTTQCSLRRNKRCRNCNADFPIMADRSGVERQERVLEDVLRERLPRCVMHLHQARLILMDRFHQLVNQIVRQIV